MSRFTPTLDFSQAPPVVGRRAMVATSQPLASSAARELLRAGGSAVDAAIGANAVLAVTEPHMCGPGGDLFAMVWDPETRALAGLNGSGRSAQGMSWERLRDGLHGRPVIPARGPLTLTTPGAVAAWAALHARYGRLPWPTLFEAAASIAETGFAVGVRTSLWWARAAREIAADKDLSGLTQAFAATFLPAGQAPLAGATMRNPGMARLFRAIACDGAAGFYAGEVAAAVERAMRACGGALAASDLAAARADWETPLHVHYRGHRVHVLPPNGQGLCLLQMLNLLSARPDSTGGPCDPLWWHLFLEAKKLAFADRARHYADPAWHQVPIAALLAPAYTAARAALIDPRRARADQTPGDIPVPASDTTYLTVADERGMMVSLIQSLFVPFGSGLVVPEFGFALQSRGSGFALDPTHPNGYAPGKRPFHTIMPGFVTVGDAPFLAFGAIGGDMQPQAQVQILARILDNGCDVAAAGALPRIRHLGGPGPNGAQDSPLGIASYEPHFPSAVVADLVRRGHVMQKSSDPIGGFVGGYQGIMRDPATGAYWGASDPRLDGCALGL